MNAHAEPESSKAHRPVRVMRFAALAALASFALCEGRRCSLQPSARGTREVCDFGVAGRFAEIE